MNDPDTLTRTRLHGLVGTFVQTIDARYTCAQSQVDANPGPEPRA